MYFVLQSVVTRNSHFHSQMWNHPKDLNVEDEYCYEVAGDWEEEYKLQREPKANEIVTTVELITL